MEYTNSHFSQSRLSLQYISSKDAPVIAAVSCFIVLLIGLYWSLLYSAGRWDGLHWGLVLTDALQICRGGRPYVDVPLFHGVLSSYIFCAFGKATEFSYLSFGLFSTTLYYIAIFIWLMVGRELRFSWAAVGAFLVIASIMHPFTLYPWYDYIAAPFFAGGVLALVRWQGGSIWSAFFCAFLFAVATCVRTTYGVSAAASIIMFVLLGIIDIRGFVRILLSAAMCVVLFLGFIYVGYSVTPVTTLVSVLTQSKIITQLLQGNVFKTFLSPHWSNPAHLYTLSAAVVIVDVFDRARSKLGGGKIRAALLIVGLIGFLANSHSFEYFRLICVSAMLPLMYLDTISSSLSSIFTDDAFFKKRAFSLLAVAISIYPAFTIIHNAYLSYPNGTTVFPVNSATPVVLTGVRVRDVTFHDPEQAAFYTTVAQVCEGRSLINWTNDVLISQMCPQELIQLRDSLPEEWVLMAIERPEFLQKITTRPLKLESSEIMFSIEPNMLGAEKILTLPVPGQDWGPKEIYAYTAAK